MMTSDELVADDNNDDDFKTVSTSTHIFFRCHFYLVKFTTGGITRAPVSPQTFCLGRSAIVIL